jgi:ABC-type proline/glycine betaine transport system substrate-binding protein
LPTTTVPGLNGLAKGDIDINMEVWRANNIQLWNKLKSSGGVVETGGVSIRGAIQGWFVPRYLVEGDKKRGLKAIAPGLISVSDLPKYKALFRDPEQPSKGRFYNCKAGWTCETVNSKKLQAYGLTKYFTDFKPGSGAALAAAIAAAYRRGRPVLAYYWGPTWILGKYDMVRLKEPPFDKSIWLKLDKAKSGKGLKAVAYPPIEVIIGANRKFAAKAPQLMTFLSKYSMQDSMINLALAFMRDKKDKTGRKAAIWFLKAYRETWSRWMPSDVAVRIDAAL